MIAVDTSALVAIFLRESEAERFKNIIVDDSGPLISAATLLEASIVMRSLAGRPVSDEELDGFVREVLTVVPVDAAQITIAREAHARYGKGMGHRAQLNFGDCFSYALARSRSIPLLYKGSDFARTDIASAA